MIDLQYPAVTELLMKDTVSDRKPGGISQAQLPITGDR